MARRELVLLWLLAAGIAGGCNAPPVERSSEIARFREHLDGQARDLKLDPARPLTMAECEDLALRNSLDLSVRRLALRLQDDQVRLALATGLPRASLDFTQTHRSNDPSVKFGDVTASFGSRDNQNLAVQGIVPVLDFGLTYYSYEIARDRRRQERLLLVRAQQLLGRDVRVAYIRHAGAIRQERMARLAVRAAQRVLEVGRALEREKMTVRADTSLLEAAVAQANLELSLSVQRVAETHLLLSQLMGLGPDQRFAIHPDLPALPPPPAPAQVAAYEDRALNIRPELAVQDLQRHISANAVRREVSAFFPRLDGLASFNWSNDPTMVNPSYFIFGYRIAHSLLNGGTTIWQHSLARKTATLEEQRTLLLSLGVMYEVQLRALQVRQAHDTIGAAATLETARKSALDRIISLYNAGLEDEAAAARSLAELTIQATVLDRAQTDYLAAWQELLAAALPADAPATRPATGPVEPATRPAAAPATRKASTP